MMAMILAFTPMFVTSWAESALVAIANLTRNRVMFRAQMCYSQALPAKTSAGSATLGAPKIA